MDESFVVTTIYELAALYDPVIAEMFVLRNRGARKRWDRGAYYSSHLVNPALDVIYTSLAEINVVPN